MLNQRTFWPQQQSLRPLRYKNPMEFNYSITQIHRDSIDDKID